uniref:Uncharacterized protein n=1 Tax=Mycena chlorophos TaxID=658473 RepID=A0ABQ0LUC9_MYCCL|nr:predicted protein [Mycena chlorophos]
MAYVPPHRRSGACTTRTIFSRLEIAEKLGLEQSNSSHGTLGLCAASPATGTKDTSEVAMDASELKKDTSESELTMPVDASEEAAMEHTLVAALEKLTMADATGGKGPGEQETGSNNISTTVASPKLRALFVFDLQPLYTQSPSRLIAKSHIQCLQPANLDTRVHYPIFLSISRHHGIYQQFKFDGWARIVKVEFPKPRSCELQEMLVQRWGDTERTEEEWFRALKTKWAVIHLEKVTTRHDNPLYRNA